MKKHTFAIVQVAWISILILGCFFLYGCAGNDDLEALSADYYPELQNLVFYGVRQITLEITPNVSQPAFAWNATGLKYIVITIFDSKIDLKTGRIANPEDAVWTWNTGLGQGREGNISFSDGYDVRNGVIQDTITSLKLGVYYIAAWGYANEYRLTHSSKEYQYVYNP